MVTWLLNRALSRPLTAKTSPRLSRVLCSGHVAIKQALSRPLTAKTSPRLSGVLCSGHVAIKQGPF